MIIVMHSTYKYVYYKQAYICMYNTCNTYIIQATVYVNDVFA